MANWNNPTLTSTYTTFVTEVKDRDVEAAVWFEGMSPTNLPTNAKRLNTTTGRFEKWNGSAWVDAVATFAFPALDVTGTARVNSVIAADGANGTVQFGSASTYGITGGVDNGGFRFNLPSSMDYQFRINSSDAMRLTSSGNLGIGTTTIGSRVTIGDPGTGLSFTNATATSGFNIGLLAGTGSAQAYVFLRDNAALLFGTNNTERLRIDSSGNLGLGVTPSAWGAGYKGFQLSTGLSLMGSSVNGNFVANGYFDGTNWRYVQNTFANNFYVNYANNGSFVWATAPSGTAGNAITFTQAMTLNASGNLLVGGTTNPYVAANRGIVQSNGATSALFGLAVGGTAAGYIFSSGSGLSIGAPTGQPILFDINGERARIDSSGNLGIGTATPSTYGKLTVWGGNVYVQSTTAGVGSKITLSDTNNQVSVESSPVGSATDMVFKTSAGTKMTLDSLGNLIASSSVTGHWQIPNGTTAQRPTGAAGQMRFNTSLSRYEGHNGTAWASIGGGATGGGGDDVFYENGQTVTTNYTITTNKNAMSAGPVTIASGITVTVPSGSTWTVV